MTEHTRRAAVDLAKSTRARRMLNDASTRPSHCAPLGGNDANPTNAQQFIDPLAAGLAYDIPQRDLDAADGGHHRRAALVLVADQVADQALDVERIARQHPAFDPLVAQRLNGPFLPLQCRLADSGQSTVGGQADEQVVPQPRARQERFEPRDLHLAPALPRRVSEPRSDCRASRSRL
jgi:hypothetical protein